MSAKLTVLIPCKNERRNIRRCVESARLVANEILVADSGSSDGTQQIARSLGCRVIEREFIGYANFKNWAIPRAIYPWVLILDADERVTPELADEIRRILARPPQHVNGYWILRRNFFLGREIKHCGWNTDRVFRLFRRDCCRYADRLVHEEIVVDRRRAGRLKNRLLHYSVWTYDQYFEKRIRYTKLSAQESWRRGKRTGFVGLCLRPFARFFQLYILRLGFLDGLPGLQVCMLTAFFNTFVRQGRLWEIEHAPERLGAAEEARREAA